MQVKLNFQLPRFMKIHAKKKHFPNYVDANFKTHIKN